MDKFAHPEFKKHERIVVRHLRQSGVFAIIAIHNSNLGPALGGCRMIPYENFDEALCDVLRLSRGMTYKAAMARVPYGGGKAVIWGDPKTQKSEELLLEMGEFIHEFDGRYISGEDMNISVSDCKMMAQKTKYVGGIVNTPTGGDPSPMTAYGVELAIRAALSAGRKSETLEGVTVLIEGLGKVGMPLAQNLSKAGARLFVTDIDNVLMHRAKDELAATAVSAEETRTLKVDVYAPCARGGVINSHTAKTLNAQIVCGSANNMLADEISGATLQDRGIIYVPDYVANCGGLIDIYYQNTGYDTEKAKMHTRSIAYDVTFDIVSIAKKFGRYTHELANTIAEARFGRKV